MRLQLQFWLTFTLASACTVYGHVIPKESFNTNAPDPFASGCNVTKSCFLVPDSCLSTGSCRAGVTVAAAGDRFQFEMMAVDSVYVAVGLSTDAFMGKDSVVECVHDATAAEKGVQIYVSFNYDTTNTRFNTTAAENGVNLVTGSFVDGVVRCTFTRDNSTRAGGFLFDLVKRQYHLLVASGTKLHQNGIAIHDRESAGSRNGRLMADVGMFVNPNDVLVDVKESKQVDEHSETADESDEYDYDYYDWFNSRSRNDSTPTPRTSGAESREEYDDHEEYARTPVECDYDYMFGSESLEDDDETGETQGFTTHGCNVTKSCYLMPHSCLHTGTPCTLAASVRKTDAGYEFEMQALESVYVAVALSTDSIMGSDSVVECVANDAEVLAFTSWNKGHKNHRIHEPLSKSGVALLEGSAVSGNVYCKFARDPITTAEGVVFDLNKSKFHLLMASGSRLKEGGIGFHDRGYAASHDARLLADLGMFAQRRRRGMIDESEEGYELADAFQPIVTIV